MSLKRRLNKVRKSDSIYSSPLNEILDFRFDERVVDVFPDMIQRSVPGYGMLITNIGILASEYAQENTYCYDLGCSLGAVTLSMRQQIQAENCTIIAVDNSPEMIERGQLLLAADEAANKVQMQCQDIQHVEINNASVVVLNFTLQFIPLVERLSLIERIYAGLNPGGVLILSEKIAFEDHQRQVFHTESHHNFKRANGYSDLEISQKRTALENVLIPESVAMHTQRLQQAGFGFVEQWFQCFNFISLIAIK
jgi:tRNA (cmo5U34)-methyltransferase